MRSMLHCKSSAAGDDWIFINAQGAQLGLMTAHIAEHCSRIAAQLWILDSHPFPGVSFTCARISTDDAQNLVPSHDRDRQIMLSRQSFADFLTNFSDFLF